MDTANHPEGNVSDIQHGWDVYSSDQEKVGSVSEVEDGYIVAHKGFFFPRDLYLPFSAIARIEHERVYLNVMKDAVDGQGWDTHPGATDVVAGDASSARSQIPDAIGTPGLTGATDEGGRTMRASGAGRQAGTAGWGTSERTRETATPVAQGANETMVLHEEQLQVNKERHQSGEVRIGKEVVEEQRTINVPVTREEVFVERVAGDGRPDQFNMNDSATQTISVPVTEETVNVEKVPVVTEEVRVGKREVQETRQVTDTVRKERARIENEGNVRTVGESDVTTERGKM